MDIKSELQKAFSSFSKTDPHKEWQQLVYTLCTECGWTQKDIEETDIPFILDFLEGRSMYYAAKKKEFDKQRRKGRQR